MESDYGEDKVEESGLELVAFTDLMQMFQVNID